MFGGRHHCLACVWRLSSDGRLFAPLKRRKTTDHGQAAHLAHHSTSHTALRFRRCPRCHPHTSGALRASHPLPCDLHPCPWICTSRLANRASANICAWWVHLI